MTTELWIFIAVGAVAAAVLYCMCVGGMPSVLQQSGYSGESFLEWYYERTNMLLGRHAQLALCQFLLCSLVNLCFCFLDVKWANLISVLPFAGMCLLFRFSATRALKVPVERTGRMKRVCAVYLILLCVIVFGVSVGLSFAAEAIGGLGVYFRFVLIAVVPLFFPAVFALSNTIVKGYDLPRNRRFRNRAEKILKESACVKVGITGSFGKTSVKNMAAAILSRKYKVIATPASFNTPLGIARTVNEQGTDCDIFLAEMGARRTGDIKELCKMVNPEYGVVTGVCSQHLESFGSEENILREKSVLAFWAKHAVLGKSVSSIDCTNKVVEGEDFDAEDIVLSAEGTRFTLRLRDERYPVQTSLLGRSAVEDIALAAALADLFGLSGKEIAEEIERLTPVPHRLERIVSGGVVILDDSYNCNEQGARDAVEILKLAGGNRFIVTPGIVELGILEREKNEKLGASLVGLERVILVGETLVLPVKRGYERAGGERERLCVVPTLKDAQTILSAELKAGDSVLFLNDLPDIYG